MFEFQSVEKIQENPLEVSARKGILKALDIIRERFEQSSEKENNLEFHNTRHTKDVIRRTALILETIQQYAPDAVSDKDIALGKIAAAFHDVVQNWEANPLPNKIIRKRFIKDNELASAEEARAFLEQENQKAEGTFTSEDLGVIEEAIRGTIPDWEPKNNTVFQPNLTEQSSLITRALALADIGTAGMDGAEMFLREGDALFREENLDIVRTLQQSESITEEQKTRFRERLLQWTQIQPTFASGRKMLLQQELQGIPLEAIPAVQKLFEKFDESILAAKNRVEERNTMSFDDLVVDMGFIKPSNVIPFPKNKI